MSGNQHDRSVREREEYMIEDDTSTQNDFIREIIDNDLKTGKHDRIATRFPPNRTGISI